MRHAFLDRYSGLESPVHQMDARAKILVFLALAVVSVTTPPGAWGAFLGYAAILLLLAAASRVPPEYLMRRCWVILPFVAMVAAFLPFLKPGGIAIFWNVLAKSSIAILSVILLSSTTPFPSLMRGFRQLGAPKIFVMLAAFAYRYLFLLVDEAERMERARDSRGYGGRWLWQARVVGRMIGTLFLRSYERAERVYAAMLSRGFDGEAVAPGGAPMGACDYAFVAAAVGALVAMRVAA